jgi:hypothetical protein
MNGLQVVKQLTTFVVSQFDSNAIANANNELKSGCWSLSECHRPLGL